MKHGTQSVPGEGAPVDSVWVCGEHRLPCRVMWRSRTHVLADILVPGIGWQRRSLSPHSVYSVNGTENGTGEQK